MAKTIVHECRSLGFRLFLCTFWDFRGAVKNLKLNCAAGPARMPARAADCICASDSADKALTLDKIGADMAPTEITQKHYYYVKTIDKPRPVPLDWLDRPVRLLLDIVNS